MSHRMKFNDVHTIPNTIVSLELWGVPIGPLRKPMRLARGCETRDLVEMLKSRGWWCGWWCQNELHACLQIHKNSTMHTINTRASASATRCHPHVPIPLAVVHVVSG
jgi:hypothetical protein